MALSFSTGYRNARMRDVSFQDMFQGGELQIWSGSAPAVDSAATGTRLVSVTLASGTRTAEIQATALVTLIGTAGTVTNITIGGYEVLGGTATFATTLTALAVDVATLINKYTGSPIKVYATSSGADVTIRACPGQGTALNTLAIVVTSAGGITNTINGASADQMGVGTGGSTAGVASANGLTFGEVAAGVIAMAGAWTGVVDNGSIAGTYFRLCGCNTPTDTSPADSLTAPTYRIQGSCGISGADHNMPGGTTLTVSTTYTVTSFTITEPAS